MNKFGVILFLIMFLLSVSLVVASDSGVQECGGLVSVGTYNLVGDTKLEWTSRYGIDMSVQFDFDILPVIEQEVLYVRANGGVPCDLLNPYCTPSRCNCHDPWVPLLVGEYYLYGHYTIVPVSLDQGSGLAQVRITQTSCDKPYIPDNLQEGHQCQVYHFETDDGEPVVKGEQEDFWGWTPVDELVLRVNSFDDDSANVSVYVGNEVLFEDEFLEGHPTISGTGYAGKFEIAHGDVALRLMLCDFYLPADNVPEYGFFASIFLVISIGLYMFRKRF